MVARTPTTRLGAEAMLAAQMAGSGTDQLIATYRRLMRAAKKTPASKDV
jgi:hypothetical protein